jgi:ankyrin repeat protein
MASLQKLVHALTLLIAIGLLAAACSNTAQDSLIDASGAGNLSRVTALLAANANVNTKTTIGLTTLMQASQNGHLEVVQALRDAGAK